MPVVGGIDVFVYMGVSIVDSGVSVIDADVGGVLTGVFCIADAAYNGVDIGVAGVGILMLILAFL